MSLILWLRCIAAVAHVIEEYLSGWVAWAKNRVKSIDLNTFIIFYVIFLAFCVMTAIVNLLVINIALIA